MALYLAKLRGVDMRAGGSDNLGASNAMILMGWSSGVIVGVHDILKAALISFSISDKHGGMLNEKALPNHAAFMPAAVRLRKK